MMLPIRSTSAPLWRQQLATVWANTSPTVKLIGAVVLLGYALSFAGGAVVALSVTPGYLLPPSFHIWTAFTFWCMELHAWEVLVDIVTVALCGKLIEPLWGRWEMVKFFWVVNAGVAVLSTCWYLAVYAGTGDVELLFHVHVHGLAGYVAGLSVAVRQIMPDLLIFRTGAGKFTNRNVPLSILFVGLVLWLIGLLDGTFPVMFTSGILVSWVYLRFYQRHGATSRGDSSDSFAFASFFPNVLQPAIDCLVAPVHLLCLRIGVVKRQTHHPLIPISTSGGGGGSTLHLGLGHSPSSASLHSQHSATIPGLSDPQNIERRRQIALKALSERLSKSGNPDMTRPQPQKSTAAAAVAEPQLVVAGAPLLTATGHPRFPRHDRHGRPFTFEVPAIPLPPPPAKPAPLVDVSAESAAAQGPESSASQHTTIDLLQ